MVNDVEEGEVQEVDILVTEVHNGDSNMHGNSNELLVDTECDGISGDNNVKGTGRKKFRRKNLFNNRSGSRDSTERPKKRPRENNDIFGLDRLIGIMSTHSDSSGGEETGREEVFMTPDLNKGVSVNVDMDIGNETEGQENSNGGIGHGPIDIEAAETIALSKALGVENLAEFGSNVKEVLRSEGYQGVEQ